MTLAKRKILIAGMGTSPAVLTSRPVVRVINGLKKGFANAAPGASRINSRG